MDLFEFQQLHRCIIEWAKGLEFAAAHAGVAGDFRLALEARVLALARGEHPPARST
jgi:hypothetical protein